MRLIIFVILMILIVASSFILTGCNTTNRGHGFNDNVSYQALKWQNQHYKHRR